MLYLIDASVYVFRAYFSIPARLTDPLGRPVNAVYGFAQFLADFLEKEAPARLAVAFDQSLTSSFRNAIYPDYKANREEPPEELLTQFALCRELCDGLGLYHCASPDYEADDLIGSLLAAARRPGEPGVIVTRDKDLAQLIEPGDFFFDYASGARLGYGDIAKRWGVRPPQIPHLLALTGDSVDNIPGVPGIGPKTAARLLEHFEDVDTLLASLESVAALPIRGAARLMDLLDTHQARIRLALKLTRIKTDLDLGASAADLEPRVAADKSLPALLDRLGFGTRLRARLERLVATW